MQRIATQLLGLAQGSTLLFSDFADNGPMWTGTGDREVRHRVTFEERFRAPPMVRVSISMWDMDRATNPRCDIAAENVTASGFEIVFRTWGDTRIARIRADWHAMGEADHPDDAEWQVD